MNHDDSANGPHDAQPWWQQSAGRADPWSTPSPSLSPQPTAVAPRRSRIGTGLAALLVAAGLVVGAGAGHLVYSPGTSGSTTAASTTLPPTSVPSTTDPSGSVAPGDSSGSISSADAGTSATSIDGAAVAAQANAGIVDVNVVLGYRGAEGAGTGIVLSSDGLILTNNHVIDGATRISVRSVATDETWTADVVGYDVSRDVALLKLQGASGLTPADLGTSADLAVGDAVVGVGNGGGDGGEPSWVAGAVTALGATITATDESGADAEQLSDLVQTDLAIVPGYSGGPLLDADGQVVGIDTAASASNAAIASTGYGRGRDARGATQAQAFAVGIKDALDVVRQIRSGVSTDTVHVGKTALIGVGAAPSATGGALVAQVLAGGPADDAGVVAGDTIASIGGQPVTSAESLAGVLDGLAPGDRVQVVVTGADAGRQTVPVTLAAGPAR